MPSTSRTRLVVLFGGRSAEHDISRISALNVVQAADPQRYDVVAVGITRAGTWHLCSTTSAGSPSADNGASAAAEPAALDIAGEQVDPFVVLGATGIGGSAQPTVVFPVLHGPNGEDGTIQGLLEVVGVPYVGSGVLGSAVSMDKAIAKTILGAHGIAQPRWRALRRHELSDGGATTRLQSIIEALGEEVFVKPANMGSSIGVSKAHGLDDLAAAVHLALHYDDVVVIEEAVAAREIETAVLGNEELLVGSIGEIRPAAEFYDYEDKYSDGAAVTIIPADLRVDTVTQIEATARAAYRALRAEGLARVDLFVDEDHPYPEQRVMVNEINTIPGFTPISMYPQLWADAGIGPTELVDRLVDLALERHRRLAGHHVDVVSSRVAR